MTDMEKKIMLRLCAKVIEYVDFETDPEAERLVNWLKWAEYSSEGFYNK